MVYVKVLSCCLMASVVLDLVLQCQSIDDPKICLPFAGCYIGTFMNAYQPDEFEAFLGVPYAMPPVRFEPSVPFRGNGTYPAKKAQFDCVQKNYFVPVWGISGSEDCLYLNVFRPKGLEYFLPVMVYIYGGGFFAGSSSPIFVGPEHLMANNDIILVTFGYRVGAFGFLSTGDDIIPGNLGLKDQVLALKWVKTYIGYFGGSEHRITLFGQSAGAVSAHMHMFSKLSHGLFYGIIAISGTGNAPFAIDNNPEYTARQTAKYCNISNWDTISTLELAQALKKVDTYVLLNAGDGLKYWNVDNLVNYRPVVEKPSPTAFISKHPDEYLRTGDYKPVPIMFGRVPNEGGVRVVAILESDRLRRQFNQHFYDYMLKFLEWPSKFNISQQIEKTEKVVDKYFDGIAFLTNRTTQAFMDLVTHRAFYHPLYNSVKHFVDKIDTNKFPVYLYNFNYLGSYTYANVYAGHPTAYEYGVIHCDDLIYLFRTRQLFPDFDSNSTEAEVVKKYVNDFTYFAHLRRPRFHQPFTPCNKTTFFPEEGKMCDYNEFTNGDNDSLVIKVNNVFPTADMKFWDDILE